MDSARERLRPGQANRADTASAPLAAPGLSALTPSTLLALQRSAGNAATARLLREADTAAADAPDIAPADDPYLIAAARGDWPAAAAALAELDDERLRREARALPPPDRAAVLDAVPEDSHRVRAALLDAWYDDAMLAGDWPGAAEALNGFTGEDILERTAHLEPEALQRLMAAARTHPKLAGGGRIVAAAHGVQGAPAQGGIFGRIEINQRLAKEGNRYWSPVEIRFQPDPKVCQCEQIAFVQTVRVVATGTNENRQRQEKLGARVNERQEAVDAWKTHRSGWYGQNNSDQFESMMVAGNSSEPRDAVLTDAPSSEQPSVTYEFETAAIARTGAQANTVYATVRWGFVVSDTNTLTALPVTKEDRASDGFGTAVEAWNRQAAGPEEGRTHAEQQPLPTFH